MAKGMAVAFFVSAIMVYFFPGYTGFLDFGVPLTPSEGRIIASVFFVGAMILYCMPERASD